MAAEQFRYVRIGHSASGCGFVIAEFERKEGISFEMVLTADDAERLCDDLRIQIRIAKFNSNGDRR